MWVQSYICELLIGEFSDMRVSPEVNLALARPFSDPPIDSEVGKQLDSFRQAGNCWECRERRQETQPTWDPQGLYSGACLECVSPIDRMPECEDVHPLGLMIKEMPPVEIIGFADSPHAYASAPNFQPRTVGKLIRAALSFLRDSTSRIS